MRSLAIFLLFLSTGFAQILLPGRNPLFPPALQQYFEFSTDQVTAIQRLNATFQQFQIEKITRSSRVQLEIAQESAKPTLDAMALGLRYLELEAIQRELRAQQTKTYEDIQKVLTPAQKTKVEALTMAIRLQGVICEAQSQNILGVPFPANRIGGIPVIGGNGQSGIASFLLGTVPAQGVFGLPGCVYPAFNRGDFTTTPGLNP